MLTLPTKKKWFDMILRGIKHEEYREIKPYYTTRLQGVIKDQDYELSLLSEEQFVMVYEVTISLPFKVKFVNGYGNDKPYFIAEVSLTVDTGFADWGAEPEKEYYVLTIDKILESGNIKEC